MWPRRPFQGGMRRGVLRNQPVNPKLVEANRLFQNGGYLQAAEKYEELGDKAYENGIPQSPRLFIQAGMSYARANEFKRALDLIEKGLGLFIERQKWGKLKQVSDSVIHRLENNGFNVQVQELKTWLDHSIPKEVKKLPVWRENFNPILKQASLPAYCPHCGGPINLEEVEWIGLTAKCLYCGNLLNNE